MPFLTTCRWKERSKQTAQDTRTSRRYQLLPRAKVTEKSPEPTRENRVSKEVKRNPLHHSERKVNFQSFIAISHKKTTEETTASTNMTSFLEFWASEPSPRLPLMLYFMVTLWLQKSTAVLPELIKQDNSTTLTLSIMRNLGFLGVWHISFVIIFKLFFSSFFKLITNTDHSFIFYPL